MEGQDFIPLVSKLTLGGNGGQDNRKRHRHGDRKPRHQNSPASPATKKPFEKLNSASNSSPTPSHSIMTARIMTYLEKNRNKEYIDIEEMSKCLHSKYPEYGRRKLRAFHNQVSEVFDKLQSGALKGDNDVDSGREQSDVSSDQQVVGAVINLEEDGEVDEATKVTGKTMNGVMANLYLQPKIEETLSPEVEIVAITNKEQNGVIMATLPPTAPEGPEQSEFERVKELAAQQARNLKARKLSSRATSPKSVRSSNTLSSSTAPMLLTSAVTPVTTRQQPKRPPEQDKSAPAAAVDLAPKKVARKKEVQSIIPTVKFSDVGGSEETIREVFKATRHLSVPQNYLQLGVPPPRGCILHGPPGCGKTLLANATAGTLQVQMIAVTGTELISGISGDSESKIRALFEQAKQTAPCILFIDGIDVIAKRRENAQKDMEVRIVSQLLSCLDDLNSLEFAPEGQVFVIGATDRLEAIDPALRTGKRLERDIAMGIPDAKARKLILEVMCKGFRFEDSIDFATLANLTPGYVGADLRVLITVAAGFAEDRHFSASEKEFRSKELLSFEYGDLFQWLGSDESVRERLKALSITFADFDAALRVVQPSAMKEGFATVPNVTFDDIGALDDIRHELEMAICAPVKYPEMIEDLGLDVPSGVLLCGPPGCGKTLLAKAVANQAGINFLSVKGPEIMNMYVGESERAVRQIFQRARNSAPCVIFFDEIDSICPRRSGQDGGSGSNRIVNQLLTEMDGVEGRKGVYVMGATNRVDMIDDAILRPGRLTNIFFVDLPTEQGREDILRKLTKNGCKPVLSADVDLAAIARSENCEGFSGADLGNLVRRAAQFRMEEYCRGQFHDKELAVVGLDHFNRAFDCVRPSVSGKQKKRYDIMKRMYSGGVAKRRRLEDEKEGEEKVIEKPAEEMDLINQSY